MVAAGVFLMARIYPLYAGETMVLQVMAVVGIATALFAALVALGQTDIKRILAYSTVSQLGLITFPFLPTELVFFADAGIAWGPVNQRTSLDLETGETTTVPVGRTLGEQSPVFSAGVSARVNVLGALIVEPYVAFPFSRYDDLTGLSRGRAIFGFNLTPGW